MSGKLTLIYRATREDDLLFPYELEALARERDITIHYVIGDRRAPGNGQLMSAQHLRKLVPDMGRRETYLCGPTAMMRSIRMKGSRPPRITSPALREWCGDCGRSSWPPVSTMMTSAQKSSPGTKPNQDVAAPVGRIGGTPHETPTLCDDGG
jgi:NAD(P)H-flavin reductase